jgi:FkbM family methyltransferase
LHRWYGRHPNIILVECALGSTEGEQTLLVSRRTPTLATLSTQWIEAVRQSPSFTRVRWDASIRVKVRTLDALIRQYGEPAFCKIDVEGYELEVLKGLSQPLPCLSFEYIPAATWLSTGCIQRLEVLGVYEFNYTVGEAAYLSLEKWTSGERMAAWLETLKPDDPSGDIYARRIPAR